MGNRSGATWSRDEVLRALREEVRRPATARDLIRTLRVPREERASFKRHLSALVDSGQLERQRGHLFGVPGRSDLVVGRLHTTASGLGFVSREGQAGGDVFVPPGGLGDAMHGDRVTVRVERRTERGDEGRVVDVVSRRHQRIVGRLEVDRAGRGFVVPFDKRLQGDVLVASQEPLPAASGEMVVVDLTKYPSETRGPEGRIVEVLGRAETPGVDTTVVLRSFGIPEEFPPEAVAEARRLGDVVRAGDVEGRTDFRQLPTVTIDGENARDFDDAITLSRLDNGLYRLGVHIADVSHYVREDSALDESAFERGTSVYFPDRAVHMFPHELSTGLCSLRPHVDRLVQSCVMDVDARGRVVRYELHDGVIHSSARMTYTAVNAIVADRDEQVRAAHAPLVPLFELMHELFAVLNERRRRRGSIDFDLPEAEVLTDLDGMVTAIVASERNVAHRMIEEFMLLANETVAGHLVRHRVPSLHRVHEAPDLKKVEEFEAFIAPLGYGLAASGQALRPRHFQRLIERMRGTPEERPIAALMLRTMQKARYDAASLGHFGLAAEEYTHFTSPIRRYPDLVVHRMLRESRRGAIDAARRDELEDALPEVARHTSEMERRADDAERELLQWKKVRFMADKVGDEFEGYVTGVAPYGLFVELVEHYVEGRVHVSSMADDFYRFVEQQHVLFGENTKKSYRLGDRVDVQVIRVDLERRQVDLGLVEILEAVRRQPGRQPRTPASRPKTVKPGGRRAQRPGRRERAARSAAEKSKKR
jgi:ribonuclease R